MKIMKYYVIDLKKCILHHAGKSQFKDPWIHYERTFGESIIYIILSGSLFLKIGDQKAALKPGDAIFMPPNTPHVGYREAEVSYFWFHCIFEDMLVLDEASALHFLESNQDSDKLLFPGYFHLNETERFVIIMHQLIHYILEDYTNIVIPHLFKASLIELVSQNKKLSHLVQFKNRRFQEIVSYIHSNFKEELSVHEIAAQFKYNEKYLSRLFKKHFGITTVQYINQVRLEYCEQLLLETSDTITNIAHAGGFKNEFYFMRCFKKKYNVSPTHYRNTYHLQMITKY